MSNILRFVSAVLAVLFIGGQVSAMTLAEFKAAVLASPKYRYAYSTNVDQANVSSLSGTGNYSLFVVFFLQPQHRCFIV